MTDYASQPPFKRGKVLPDKRILQETWLNDCDKDSSVHLEEGGCCKASSSWSSTLTASQRRCWERLLKQRHTLALDLPLAELPDDLVLHITSFLDVQSLLQMRCLNRKYRDMCGRNEAGWDLLCWKLWEKKVHISRDALSLCSSSSASSSSSTTSRHDTMMKAYQTSVQDARDRHSISLQELCYDGDSQQGTIWSFRFKESAGSDWTLADPWYNGEPCRKMVFLRNGSIKHYSPDSSTHLRSTRFGTTNNNSRLIELPGGVDNDAVDDILPHPELLPDPPLHGNNRVLDPPMTMTWRFLTRPMDLPERSVGSYIRISVGGRDVPTYSIRRSPTGNWGFVMESCWGLFASFELPTRIPRSVQRIEPARSRQTLLRRTPHGNVWLDIMVDELDFLVDEIQEVDDDDIVAVVGDEASQESDISLSPVQVQEVEEEEDALLPLRDDSFMVVTNEIQWREAFLYNIGARILPDGDEAAHEFDRAWGTA